MGGGGGGRGSTEKQCWPAAITRTAALINVTGASTKDGINVPIALSAFRDKRGASFLGKSVIRVDVTPDRAMTMMMMAVVVVVVMMMRTCILRRLPAKALK